MAKRKVTLTELPAGRVPRQRGRVRGVSRAIGFAGGDVRTFAPAGRLQELERIMKTNGRKLDLERELRARKREEKSELELRPWQVKTIAAQAQARLRDDVERRRQHELRERRELALRVAAIKREAEVRAAFEWRKEQARSRKEAAA